MIQVNETIDAAKGKVLVIDEAYVLSRTMYGKEALDTLVGIVVHILS